MIITALGKHNSFWQIKLWDEFLDRQGVLNILNQTDKYKYLVEINIRAVIVWRINYEEGLRN